MIEGVKENVSLATYATFKVGGPAEYFAVVKNPEELGRLAREAKANSLSLTVIGGGSNVLIPDSGIKGLVIKNEIDGLSYHDEGDSVLVTAGSGMAWDDLVKDTISHGLWGLENLSAIPGTVGATPIQNVGAYGREVSELIESVNVYDLVEDKLVKLSATDCGFGYRDSYFKTKEGKRYVVVGVVYRLSKIPQPLIQYKDLALRFADNPTPSLSEIRQAIIEIRAAKFPDLSLVGTAGSFFKNPVISTAEAEDLRIAYPDLPLFPQSNGQVKVSLGFVLDKICNLRGYRQGNVGLFDKQALVLVNHGDANADEIEAFAEVVAAQVFQKTKLKIEWEVNKIGN